MSEAKPYADDPFFSTVADTDWNACLGRQGEEENYLDGYIEAAIELADAIINKKLFGQRDTLVLPVLYNARHGIELALKFTTDRLVAAGVIICNDYKRDHNIRAYWERLHVSTVGDEKLSQTIAALKPFVDSLSRIDSDGQELRYHLNRDNDLSLANYSLANLLLIQTSLRKLKELINDLKYRTIKLVDERATGSYTKHCSRMDLLMIAQLMPSRRLWSTEAFDEQKKLVRERYGLGNRQFSIALDAIQKNREMRSIVGMESDLLYLTDDEVIRIIEQWRHIHPALQKEEANLGLDYFDANRLEAMAEHVSTLREVITEIEAKLLPEALAELETMFYFGRDRFFVEYYEIAIERKRKEYAAANNLREGIRHLMEKTNFLQCIRRAAAKLGRSSLAERLRAM
jgi:hypothetical protein